MEFEILRDAIVQVMKVDANEITMDTSFVDDLGADSLDVFQIILVVEPQLKIHIDTDKAENIKTVGDAVALIKETIA